MSTTFIPNLRSKVKSTYEAGVAAGDVHFTPSEVHTLTEHGIEFELRCAEALKRKPKPSPEEKEKDPFMPPYAPHSLVVEHTDDISKEEFVVLLNKFPVVERHFMLCTKDFEPQTLPPTPAELYTTLKILAQFDSTAESLRREPHLAFFNCGALSGASQPHKHLQIVPLRLGEAPMDQHIENAKPSELKPNECFSLPEDLLPPAHFIGDLSKATKLASTDPEQCQDLLGSILATLLDAAFDNFRHLTGVQAENVPQRMGQMNYNLVFTTKWIMLVPRSEGDYILPNDAGKIPLNALCWAGMLMTKEESHVELLKTVGVRNMLQRVGVPRASQQEEGEVP